MNNYSDYPADLRDHMETFGLDIDDLMNQFQAGEIDLSEWRDTFAALMTTFIALAFVVGSGHPSIDQRGQEMITAQVAKQLDYLNGFDSAIRVTQDAGGEYSSSWNSRARMYVTGMAAPYWMGYGEGLDLPAYPGDGSSICGQGDKCRWEIHWLDDTHGDADAYWKLAPAEHCQTCIERERRWNPLKFRGWELDLPDVEELKHLQGKHNQKRHGWRYGVGNITKNDDPEYEVRARAHLRNRPDSVPADIAAAKKQISAARTVLAGFVSGKKAEIEALKKDSPESKKIIEASQAKEKARKEVSDLLDVYYRHQDKSHEIDDELQGILGTPEALTLAGNARIDLLRQKWTDERSAMEKADTLLNIARDKFKKSEEKESALLVNAQKISKIEHEIQVARDHYVMDNADAARKVLEWERGNAAAVRARIEKQAAIKDSIVAESQKRTDGMADKVVEAFNAGDHATADRIKDELLVHLERQNAASRDLFRYIEVPLTQKGSENIPVEFPGTLKGEGAYKGLMNNEAAWYIGNNPLMRTNPVRVEALPSGTHRAHADKDDVIRMDPDRQSNGTLIHETGHILEARDRIIGGFATEFLVRRTRDAKPEKMKDIYKDDGYDDHEEAIRDAFIHAYMGKLYNFRATEITSMGLQMFFEDPYKLMKQDPDYFDFLYAVLRLGE